MVSIVEFMYFRVAMNKFGNANPKMPTFQLKILNIVL